MMSKESDIARRIADFDWAVHQEWARMRIKMELSRVELGAQNVKQARENVLNIGRELEHSLRRWAHTMDTHRTVQKGLVELQEIGVASYRVIAEADEKSTDMCQILDGQEFSITQAQIGINLPPFHFNCRCRIDLPREWESEEDVVGTLSRAREIALIMEFLRYISALADEEGGWRKRMATDAELLQIATDFVDMLRWLEQFGNADGYLNIIHEDVHAAFGLDVLHAVIRLTGFDVGSGVRSRYAINEISRMHDALGSGYAWPYVNAEMLLLLSIHRVILDSGAQTAIDVSASFLIVGGLLLGLPALVSWLVSPAAVGAVGGAGTVAGMYLERIKAFVGMGGDRVPAQLNFTNATLRHMHDPARHVPHHILRETIRFGHVMPDPRGSTAQMFFATITKNGRLYNLEVLYHRATNTIWHFEYSRDAIGHLPAILR